VLKPRRPDREDEGVEGERNEGGVPLPIRLEIWGSVWGSVISSPSEVWGRVLAENSIEAY